MLNSVRARLTLWYVLVFGTLLIGFMVFVYTLLSRSLYDRLDYSLANNARAIVAEFLSEIGEQHGDARAGAEMRDWDRLLPKFWQVVPKEMVHRLDKPLAEEEAVHHRA